MHAPTTTQAGYCHLANLGSRQHESLAQHFTQVLQAAGIPWPQTPFFLCSLQGCTFVLGVQLTIYASAQLLRSNGKPLVLRHKLSYLLPTAHMAQKLAVFKTKNKRSMQSVQ